MTDHSHSFTTNTTNYGAHTHGIYTSAPTLDSITKILQDTYKPMIEQTIFNGIPVYVDRDAPPGKAYWISEALVHQQFLDTIKDDSIFQDKDTHMDTAAKIAKERAEARERAEIEALYATYDGWTAADGMVIRFTWNPGSKDYLYAAVYTNDAWYITGATSPQAQAHDNFIDWLVARKIARESIDMILGGDDE